MPKHTTDHENNGIDFWRDFSDDFAWIQAPQSSRIIYVNQDDSISEAIVTANDGDIIFIEVECGIIEESIELNKNVTIYGVQGGYKWHPCLLQNKQLLT